MPESEGSVESSPSLGVASARRWPWRWVCLAVSLAFLARVLFGSGSLWSAAGFFAFGAAWYVLTWRRARELDSPRPR